MLKNMILLVCLLIAFILISSCVQDKAANPSDLPPFKFAEITIKSSPDIGTIGTEFVFSLAGINDLSPSSPYQLQCDWNNDGVFDTEWLDSLTVSHVFVHSGKQIVHFMLRDHSDHKVSLLDTVFTCEFIDMTPMVEDGMPGNVDWAPDGSNRIAFDWSTGGCEHQIYVMDFPDGTPARITFDGDNKCHQYPEWSPDGMKIVYVNNVDNTIECISMETKEITTLIKQNRSPFAWSPDGKGILSSTNRYGTDSLYYYHFDRGCDSLILTGPGSFCWSPDGDVVAYSKFLSQYGSIYFFSFQSGSLIKELPVTTVKYWSPKMDWSSDGKWIILGNDDTDELYILNCQTEKEHHIICGQFDYVQYPSWSSDNSMLVFEGRLKNSLRWSIWAIRFPVDLYNS